MKIETKEVFAVEIEDLIYHLDHAPAGAAITEENLIMIDDKDTDYL